MKNLIQTYALGACLTVLSLSLMPQAVFADDMVTRISYLDSAANSYLSKSSDVDMGAIEASFKLDNKPVITNKKIKIKLSLRDSDIKQVLRMLADKAGVNIVFDKSIDGKITLDLNDIDINDAFMVIFKTMQYAHIMDGNTLTVITLDEYKKLGYVRQNMTVIPVKYANSENVATFLNKNLFGSNIFGLSNRSIVTSNPATNQIIVFGSNADVMAIKRILPVIDTKPTISSFKVNHTTPKEMANLICDTLFYNSGESGSSKGSESGSLSEEEIVLGGGVIACRDSSNSNDGGSDDLTAFKTNPLTISYFPELGKISAIGGSPEKVELIKNFIKEHDKKQLMAYIELSIISLNESGSRSFTNQWNLWTPFISLGFDGTSLSVGGGDNPLYLWGNRVVSGARTATLNPDGTRVFDSTQTETYRTNNKAIKYALTYAIENGNGRVLTNPKIMVTNGRKATIDLTSDYVKSTQTQVLSDGVLGGATNKTYQIGNDNGLKIELVPFISPEGYVSMNLTPNFANISGQTKDPDTGDTLVTLLQRSDIELKNVRVRDGETLVLAGFITETETQSTTKMPVLSDLPFVGAFFRSSGTERIRNELVIVVTPHIIKDSDSIDSNIYDL